MFRSELGVWLSIVDCGSCYMKPCSMHLTGSDMKIARLTIVTAILFQNIWFPQRLLKLLGCRGQLILLAALILHSLSLWYL